jgi:hypothetical protein
LLQGRGVVESAASSSCPRLATLRGEGGQPPDRLGGRPIAGSAIIANASTLAAAMRSSTTERDPDLAKATVAGARGAVFAGSGLATDASEASSRGLSHASSGTARCRLGI